MKTAMYRNDIFKRIISGLLAVVIFFNAAPLDLSVFADDNTTMMGIYNNFMVSSANSEQMTKYTIKYLRKKQMTDSSGNPVYNSDGTPKYQPQYEKDENGDIIYIDEYVRDADNNIVLDANGDPVIQRVPKPLLVNDEIQYEIEDFTSSDFFEYNNGGTYTYIEATGTINMHPGETLNFLSSNDFKDFLIKNRIETIEVTYDPDNDAFLYDPDKAADADDQSQALGNTAVMTYDVKITENQDTHEKNIDVSDCTAITFTSSDYIDLDVTVKWVDDGNGRPDVTDWDFDVKRKAYAQNESIPAYDASTDYDANSSYEESGALAGYTDYEIDVPTPDTTSSNTHIFNYKLPRAAKNGDTFDYIAINNHKNFTDSDYQGVSNPKEYRYERAGKEEFKYFCKTQFTFDISWHDDNNAINSRPDVTNENIKQYIKDHFVLKNKNTNETIDLDDYTVSLTQNDDGTYRVTVDGLDEIDDGSGSAVTYYLEQNSAVIKTSDSSSSDYYALTAQNSGVHSSESDKIYNGSTAVLLLSGEDTFSGEVQWKDEARKTERESKSNIANYVLWRYVGTDTDMKAQVGTFSIDGNADNFSYTDTNGDSIIIPKYDVMGRKYVYYAKQRSFKLSGYEHSYIGGTSTGVADSFSNDAVIQYRLAGTVNYAVNAHWIAAALQGGTGEVRYELQRYNSDTNSWEDVPHEKTNPSQSTTNKSELVIDGFSAEQTSITGAFYEADDDVLPTKYDENGNLIIYRIVQTYADRTDQGVSGNTPYETLISLVVDTETGAFETVTVDGKNYLQLTNGSTPQDANGFVYITVDGLKFKVRAYIDDGTVRFEYILYDEIDVVVNKNWSDPTVDNILDIWGSTVKNKLQVFDYSTGAFVDCQNYNTIYPHLSEIIDEYGNINVKRNDIGKNERDDDTSYNDADDEHYSIRLKDLPMYDDQGRLNKYQIVETSVTKKNGEQIPSKKVYSSSTYIQKDVDNNELIVSNSFVGDGESIKFKKIWLADGEEQYKTNIGIQASIRAMPRPDTDKDTDYVSPNYKQSISAVANRLNKRNGKTKGQEGYIDVTGWEDIENTTELETWILQMKQKIYDDWKAAYIDNIWERADKYIENSTDKRYTWKNEQLSSSISYDPENWIINGYTKEEDGIRYVNVGRLAWDYITNKANLPTRPDNYNDNTPSITAAKTKNEWQQMSGHKYFPWESGYGGSDDIFPELDENNPQSSQTNVTDYPWPEYTGSGWSRNANNFTDVLLSANTENVGNKLDFTSTTDYPNISTTQKNQYSTFVNNVKTDKKLLSTGITLKEDNTWESELGIYPDYNKGTGDGQSQNNYDLRDFREYLAPGQNSNGTTQKSVTSQEFIAVKDNNGTEIEPVKTASNKWVEGAKTTYWYQGDDQSQQQAATNSTDMLNQNVSYISNGKDVIAYSWLAGVLKATYEGGLTRYYAVQEVPQYKGGTPTDENHNKGISEITFMNNRCGVVNYHVQFDWKVGDMIKNGTLKKLKLKLQADYGSGYTDLIIDNNPYFEITITEDLTDYYIYNLPKYTNLGNLITYRISEYSINDDIVFNNDVSDTVRFEKDGTTYQVEREDLATQFNTSSNSDDCYNVKFTNSLSGTTQTTVYKAWIDDSNDQGTGRRPELYIRLYHQSVSDLNGVTTIKQPFARADLGKDYLWEGSNYTDIWTYTYQNLDKYDDDGYPYTYYVEEFPGDLAAYDYVTHYYKGHIDNDDYVNVSGKVIREITGLKNVSNEDVNGIDSLAMDGDTIVNKRKKEINIQGTKVWQNIAESLQKKNYPIADIFLYKTTKQANITTAENVYAVPMGQLAGKKLYISLDGLPDKDEDNNSYVYQVFECNANGDNETSIEFNKTGDVIEFSKDNTGSVFYFKIKRTKTTNSDPSTTTTELIKAESVSTYVESSDGQYSLIEYNEDDENKNKTELINITQIFKGDATFGFGREGTLKKNNNEVQYTSHGNALFDYVDGQNEKGLYLPKYDERGALIKYSMRERAINGYTFHISDQTIINDYTGGDKVKIKFHKDWKNMVEDTANAYPKLVITLHQAYIGKDSSNDIQLKDYKTYSKVFYPNSERAKSFEAIFGDTEDLRKYAPDGNEFYYYITERMIDAEHTPGDSLSSNYYCDFQNTYIVAKKNGNSYINTQNNQALDTQNYKKVYPSENDIKIYNDKNDTVMGEYCVFKKTESDGGLEKHSGMGFICTIEEVIPKVTHYKDVDGNLSNVVIADNKYYDSNNPDGIELSTDTLINQYLSGKSVDYHDEDVIVTNRYQPDIENFQGHITVDKSWNNRDSQAENSKNSEFEEISNYKFTLKRKTMKVKEKSLFQIVTGGYYSNRPNVPRIVIGAGLTDGVFQISYNDANDKLVTEWVDENGQHYIKYVDDSNQTVTEILAENAEAPKHPKFYPYGYDDKKLQNYDEAILTEADYKYYACKMVLKKNAYGDIEIPVQVRVYPSSEDRRVEIYGLAIYAQDGVPYTYIIEEVAASAYEASPLRATRQMVVDHASTENTTGYAPVNSLYTVPVDYVQRGKLFLRIEDLPKKDGSNNSYTYSVEECDQNGASLAKQSINLHYENKENNKVALELSKEYADDYSRKLYFKIKRTAGNTTEYLDDASKKAIVYDRYGSDSFALTNILKTFDLRLNKVFGRWYTDSNNQKKYEVITSEDYSQFFNQKYIDSLRFQIQRKLTTDSQWEPYDYRMMSSQSGKTSADAGVISGSQLIYDSGNGTYYFKFIDLPLYKPGSSLLEEDKVYEYRIVEFNEAELDVNVNAKDPATTLSAFYLKVGRKTTEGNTEPEYLTTGFTAKIPGGSDLTVTNGVISVPNPASSNAKIAIEGLNFSDVNGKSYIYEAVQCDLNGDVTSPETIDISGVRLGVWKSQDTEHVEMHYPQYQNDINNVASQTSPYTKHETSQTIKGTTQNVYVRNIFESKSITLDKYWDDDNNADGLRPESLQIRIYENVPNSGNNGAEFLPSTNPVVINKTLKSSEEWHKIVALPMYYYNGKAPIADLTYSIREKTLDAVVTNNGYVHTDYGYKKKENDNVTRVSLAGKETANAPFKLPGADGTDTQPLYGVSSETAVTPIKISDDDFVGLYLENTKTRVNSVLTFTKDWDDDKYKADYRPDNVYVKILRNTKNTATIDDSNMFVVDGLVKDEDTNIIIRNLAENYDYQVLICTSTGSLIETITPTVTTADGVTECSFTTKVTAENQKLYFRLRQKTTNSNSYTVVNKDINGSRLVAIVDKSNISQSDVVKADNQNNPVGIVINSTSYNAAGGVYTIPAGNAANGYNTVVIQNLLKKSGNDVYNYSLVDENGNALNGTNPSLTLYQNVDNPNNYNAMIVYNGTDEFKFKLKQRLGDAQATDVGDSAKRFISADQTTGVVELPVDKNTDKADYYFENLSYGTNASGNTQINGTWSPYYYTVVECDRNGNDITAVMSDTNTPKNETTDSKINVSKKIKFTISGLESIAESKTYINLKITRNGGSATDQIVVYDVNNRPVHITLQETVNGTDQTVNNEYYASVGSVVSNGIIVVPIPSNGSNITGYIEDLPVGYEYNGTWSEYTYNIVRCKANGDNHGTPVTVTPYPLKCEYEYEPLYTDLTFTKTWDSSASDYKLRPSEVYFKLYRTYDGATGADADELVTTFGDNTALTAKINDAVHNISPENGYFTLPVSSDSLTVSFEGLPNGKVVADGHGNGIWKEYKYYIKEVDSNNTDLASTSPYEWEQKKGVEKPFNITKVSNYYTKATLSEGIENSIIKTEHKLEKTWFDEDNTYDIRKNYVVTLQRREGDHGNWQNVDLSGTEITAKEKSDGTPVSLNAEGTNHELLNLTKDKLYAVVSNLPKYSSSGNEYTYRFIEASIGGNDVKGNNASLEENYLFHIPGRNGAETSYVTQWHTGTKDYSVDYDYNTTATSKVTNSVVTNAVSFVSVSANLNWVDEWNLYGKRPESVTYKLWRTKTTITDTGKNDSDGNKIYYRSEPVIDGDFKNYVTVDESEAKDWKHEWSTCAAFDDKGNEYDYFVDIYLNNQDEVIPYYESSGTSNIGYDEHGHIAKKYVFTETYNPPRKSITVSKKWNDQENIFGYRPNDITVNLSCKYEVTEEIYTEKQNDNTVKAYYIKEGDKYYYSGPLSGLYSIVNNDTYTAYSEGSTKTLTSNDSWAYKSFDGLPAWVNPTGTARTNGEYVRVTYYLTENCPANYTCTTADPILLIDTGMRYDSKSADVNNQGIITIPVNSYFKDGNNVKAMIPHLSEKDSYGNTYVYTITEVDSEGNAVSSSDMSATKNEKYDISHDNEIAYDISKPISIESPPDNIYVKVTRAHKVSETKTCTINNTNTITPSETCSVVNSQVVMVQVPKDTSTILTFDVANLPAQNNGHNLTYSAELVDYEGNVQPQDDVTYTSSVTDSITFSVTKSNISTDTTRPEHLFFKIKSNCSYTETETVKKDFSNQDLKAVVFKEEPDVTKVTNTDNPVLLEVPENRSYTFENTLITRDVVVVRNWNDNDYASEKGAAQQTILNDMHYNQKVVLTSDDFGSAVTGRQITEGAYTGFQYSESRVIGSSENAVVFKNLPKFKADGKTEISYKLFMDKTTDAESTGTDVYTDTLPTENGTKITNIADSYRFGTPSANGSKEYGYDSDCYVNQGDTLTKYTIINELPLTAVDVIKTWDDRSNIFKLRPAVPVAHKDSNNKVTTVDPDPLGMTLTTTTTPSIDNSWAAPQSYILKDSVPTDNNNDTWTYSYQKLLKYNKNNQHYYFKADEHFIEQYVNETAKVGDTSYTATDNLYTVPEKDVQNTYCVVFENLPTKDDFGRSYTYIAERCKSDGTAADTQNLTVTTTDTNTVISGTADTNPDNNSEYLYFKLKRRSSHLMDYNDPSYTKHNFSQISEVEVANHIYDGVHALSTQLTLTNALDTRTVTVKKDWYDNDYDSTLASDLHYDLDITLSSPTLECTDNDKKDNSGKYKETIKLTKGNTTGVTFTGLPKYDASGDVIVYNVREDANPKNTSPAADRAAVNITKKTEVTNYDLETAPKFTDGDRHYGYVGSAVYTAENEGTKNYLSQVDITNTLPLTAVKVVKHWDDFSNKYSIRPSSIDLKLTAKTTNDGSTWVDPANDSGNHYLSTTSMTTPTIYTSAGDDWTYTYTKLLKYDVKNLPYSFKVEETFTSPATSVTGYTAPKYCRPSENDNNRQTVTGDALDTLSSGSTWDGNTALSTPMELTNSLDTRDIIVTKTWADNGYTGTDTHYNVKVTLDADNDLTIKEKTIGATVDDLACNVDAATGLITVNVPANTTKSVVIGGLPKKDESGADYTYTVVQCNNIGAQTGTLTPTINSSGDYNVITVSVNNSEAQASDCYIKVKRNTTETVRRIPNNTANAYTDSQIINSRAGSGYSVVFKDVPKYKSDGTAYIFKLTETPSDAVADASTIGQTSGSTVVNSHEFTVSATRFGYTGTCKKKTSGTGNKAYVEQYDITNTLPVYAFNADVEWDDDNNRDGKRPTSDNLSVILSRRIGTGTKSTVATVSTKSDADNKWNYTLTGAVPKYSESNVLYIYSISENDFTNYGSYTRKYSKSITMVASGLPTNNSAESGTNEVSDMNTTTTDTVATFHIKNEYIPEKGSITINKTWAGETLEGHDYRSVARPNDLTVTLKRKYQGENDTVTEETVGTYNGSWTKNDDTWSLTIENLYLNTNPTADKVTNGASKVYTYYFEETVPGGYTVTYSPTQNKGVKLVKDGTVYMGATNTLNKKKVKFYKEWDDSNYSDRDHIHYDVTADIKLNGTVVKNVTIPNGNTTGVEVELPENIGGTATSYTLTETNIKYHYNPTYKVGNSGSYDATATFNTSDNSVTIKNSLPLVRFIVHKDWDDDSNRDNKRPESLTFTLTQNGNLIKSDITTSPGGWTSDYTPYYLVYDKNNAKYTYSITENDFANKSTDYAGSPMSTVISDTVSGNLTEYTYTFTNKKVTTYKGDLQANKKWDGDETHKEYTRPANVTVQLWCSYNGGEPIYAANADYVKSFVGSEYVFEQTLNSDNIWSYKFENLPLYMNDGGTDSVHPETNGEQNNGTFYQITYYIMEKDTNTGGLTGYDTSYSNTGAITKTTYSYNDVGVQLENGDDKSINVINTLKTTSVTVNKAWSNNSCPETLAEDRYNVNISVTSTDIASYNQTKSTTNNTVTFDGLPLYKSDGTAAEYKIEELTTTPENPHKYNFTPSYSVTNGQFKPTATHQITVTNTLPITEIVITKNWLDKFENLDYSSFRQTVNFEIQRRTDGTNWETLPEVYTASIPESKDNANNKWTYTISNLLKYDVNNKPYMFKIKELPVNGYERTSPADTDTITETAAADSHSFAFTNRLYTRDITVNKKWDDSGYTPQSGENLHYDIDITLSKDAVDNVNPAISYTGKINAGTTYDSTQVVSGGSVIFKNVPVFDKSGAVIEYTVSESPCRANESAEVTTPYGYYLVSGYPTSTNTTVNSQSCISTYTFQNKLPVVNIPVTKTWNVDTKYHTYQKSNVTVQLKRESTNESQKQVDEKAIELSNGTNDSYTFSNQLKYDAEYNAYTYSVTETKLEGFNVSYSPQNVTSTDNSLALGVTNTMITGDAEVRKIDKYIFNVDNGVEIPVSDAYFELYQKDSSNNNVYVNVRLLSESDDDVGENKTYPASYVGYYVIDNRTGASNHYVKSGSDGYIKFKDLPLNNYYLKECEGSNDTPLPTGFVLNTEEYHFTVGVENAAATASTTSYYTGDNNGTPYGFIVSKDNQNRIGNEENVPQVVIGIQKFDAEDNTKTLQGASYLVLRMKHFENRTTGETSEDDFIANAKKSVEESGRIYSEDKAIAKYWNKIGSGITDSEGKFIINNKLDGTDIIFGTYAFLEVQAPIGYECTYDRNYPRTDSYEGNDLYVEVSATQMTPPVIVHENPRKSTQLDILKTDEFGDPLNGAEFELYYRSTKTKEIKTYSYDYKANGTIATPSVSGVQAIQPRTDPDYIYKDNYINGNRWIPGYEIQLTFETGWDDPHIYFLDENDMPILQPNPGYLLEKANPSDLYYTIRTPVNAAKFVLNNGINKGSYSKTSTATEIIADADGLAKYTVPSTGESGKYVLTSTSVPTPVVQKFAAEKKATDIHIATVVTGDDGQTEKITWLKPEAGHESENPQTTVDSDYIGNPVGDINNSAVKKVKIVKWGVYYWLEKSAPKGYNKDREISEPFVVDAEEADKVINIDKAIDTRQKGKVELTKKSEQKLGSADIGAVLSGAEFELYKKGTTDVRQYLLKKSSNEYLVVVAETGKSEIQGSAGSEYLNVTDADLKNTLTTAGYEVNGDNNDSHFKLYTVATTAATTGKFLIEGIDWGQYYLKETKAPDNYTNIDSSTNQPNKVEFSVGRNNCGDVKQELVCTDEIESAKIQITKTINEYIDAWGTPTFIFKIKGMNDEHSAYTDYERTVSLQVTSKDNKFSTDEIKVEPGVYEVSEINVSRYSVLSCSIDTTNSVQTYTDYSTENSGKAVFKVEKNGKVVVDFKNTIDYYDKFTHTNLQRNDFHGYKGIKVVYNQLIDLDDTDSLANNKTTTIEKKNLTGYLIPSGGGNYVPMTTEQLEQLSFTYTNPGEDDARFGTSFKDNTDAKTITVNNSQIVSAGCSYVVKATYGGLTTDLTLNFKERTHPTKITKTVIFKADSDNYSYFEDENERTSEYVYVYTIDSSTQTVLSITHNGKPVKEADVKIPPSDYINVNEAYRSSKTFSIWESDNQSYDLSSFDLWKGLSGDDTITFTATLVDS